MSQRPAPPVIIGIDAGGTHTRAVAMTQEGEVVARTRRAAANPRTVGDGEAQAQIEAAVADLRRTTGAEILHVGIGSAGLVDPAPPEEEQAWARRLDVPAVTVDSDARIAHAAAFGAGAGVMVVAGTGSQCLAFAPDGARVRVGGWGPTFGDEGSAYWIAREAIRRALRALDEQVSHPFLGALLDVAGATPDAPPAGRHAALLSYLYGADATPGGHAAFAVHVSRLADQDVHEALELLRLAGEHLAALASTAAARVGVDTVAYAGSVLEENAVVRGAFARACRRYGLEPIERRWDPAVGAASLAWRRANEGAIVENDPRDHP